MKRIIMLTVVFVLVGSHQAQAADEPTHPVEQNLDVAHYPTAVAAKVVCGASNVAFSWAEILWYPSVSNNRFMGVLSGPFRFVGRLLVGGVQLATFPIPQARIRVMAPECGMSIVDPYRYNGDGIVRGNL